MKSLKAQIDELERSSVKQMDENTFKKEKKQTTVTN